VAYELSFFDLTTSQRTSFSMLPKDSEMTLEQPQGLQESPILGGYPNLQILAAGVRQLTMTLELYGEAGNEFYETFIEPAYGLSDGSYQPHLIQIAWGSSRNEAFTGRPIGQPPTRMMLGKETGSIFSRTFDFILRQTQNNAPKIVNVATGQVVQAASVTHTVVQGDDLLSIAKKYGVKPVTIANANPGITHDPALGSRLIIPK
jgi:LysM repeat protein